MSLKKHLRFADVYRMQPGNHRLFLGASHPPCGCNCQRLQVARVLNKITWRPLLECHHGSPVDAPRLADGCTLCLHGMFWTEGAAHCFAIGHERIGTLCCCQVHLPTATAIPHQHPCVVYLHVRVFHSQASWRPNLLQNAPIPLTCSMLHSHNGLALRGASWWFKTCNLSLHLSCLQGSGSVQGAGGGAGGAGTSAGEQASHSITADRHEHCSGRPWACSCGMMGIGCTGQAQGAGMYEVLGGQAQGAEEGVGWAV